ncbi:MAG TPA: DUF4202 family protein [Longimicrobiales bacterium]|nr:DUF4202 family protein [Longimicrobiales bacterium]
MSSRTFRAPARELQGGSGTMREASIAARMAAGPEGGSRDDGEAPAALRRAFPFLDFSWGAPGPDLSVRAWRDPGLDFWSFDRRYDGRRGPRFCFVLEGPRGELEAELGTVLTRLQRLFGRRNRHSRDARFDELLVRHAVIHDVRRPLVRADYDHALDVWQWVLRLDPEASLALQLAALLHDIERLDSEADARAEHRARDYERFKAEHAERSAARVTGLVLRCGYPPRVARRASALVRGHEAPSQDPEAQLLADADALSFFSLNAPGFAAWFPREHTERKVRFTLARMSASARAQLASIRMPDAVREAIERCDPSAEVPWSRP